MSLESVKQLLSDFGWEYKISSNIDLIYSTNYEKIVKEEIYKDIYKQGEFYFKRKVKFIKIKNIEYKIEYLEDITEYIEFIISLKKDKLTGLYTREELENYMSKLKRTSVIVLCDIDDFKRVNDTYGHQEGDKVLTLLGTIIRNNIRKNDFAGRYGGEEFLIIFDTNQIDLVRQRIDKINKEFNLQTGNLSLTFSAGICSHEGDNKVTDTIKNCDLALYHAKQNGKNKSVVYHELLEESLKKITN